MSYFNTTHVRGQKLIEYQILATKQETLIFEFFKRNAFGQWTPEDIKRFHPKFRNTPLTSIRRVFTNLKGRIYKTDNKVDGMYGRPIYTWQIMPF